MKISTMERFERAFLGEPNSGCWLWMKGGGGDGYGCFYYNGERNWAHRVSWELYAGPIPEKVSVLHKCDTPSCVRPDHLFLGTRADNVADMVSKSRNQKGARHWNARLSESDVKSIRQTYSSGGVTQGAIARFFDIPRQLVHAIVHNRLWRHLTTEGQTK